ncbi:MAG: TIGR03086 family protein [Actinobacteria bacterium]|nr:TIGR03086 family protein [Actinomycetota bacterium]
MELIDMLENGHASTARILAGVSPDQLGQPTPCSEWDVRGLINHIVGGAFFFAAVAETGKPPEGAGGDTDFTAGDMAENYAQAVKADLAAWARPGALEQMCELPFGTMPGQFALSLHFVDNLTHGWDLARATGQDETLDPELCGAAMAMVEASISDDIRSTQPGAPFGPKVDVADGAAPHERLVAFLGRHP